MAGAPGFDPLAVGVVTMGRSFGAGSERIAPMAHLDLVALVVREYEPAIDFFARVLGFDLVEDEPSLTNDGRPKRCGLAGQPRLFHLRSRAS